MFYLSGRLSTDKGVMISPTSVAAPLIVIILVVGCSIGFLLWYRKRQNFISPRGEEWVFDPDRPVAEQVSELPYSLHWEFPRPDVTLKKLIGEGGFGEVWEGIAEGINAFRPRDKTDLALRSKLFNIYMRKHNANDFWVKYFRHCYYQPKYSEGVQVAVKCLKPGAEGKVHKDLENELKLMQHIGGHKNIVNLLGACTQKGPLLLIMEFCINGDLKSLFRTKHLSLTWNRLELESEDHLCFVDLIRMSMEVAEGNNFTDSSYYTNLTMMRKNV